MGRMKIYEIHHGSRRVLTGQVYYGSNAVSGVRYTTNRVTGSSSDKSYGFDMLGRVNLIYWDRTTTDEINYDRYDRVSLYQIGGYNGTWYSYQYDDNNNLIQIGKRTPNGPPVTMPYIDFTYNSKNQLVTYEVDNTTKYYSYDNLGNPVKYGVSSQSAAENMVWTQGTKLASGNYKGNSFSYKYDANGLRYEKTVNGITTRQYLEGDKIIAEEILNASGSVAHTKYYIYDQTGIAGMVYDGESYYFGKNIFGDVTTIYDCYGNWKASYEYDLWGNITSGGSSGIAKENPFRYRGYYYDSETGFYYLQSRYYDPEICRFINADNLELLPTLSGTPGQLNLYAYCNNNPVMYSDPSGTITISLVVGLIISFSIGFSASAITQGLQYGWDNIQWGQAVFDGAMAALSSALLATGVSSIVGKTISAAMNFGQYAVDSAFHGENPTWGGAITSVVVGLISGGAGKSNASALAKSASGSAKMVIAHSGASRIQFSKVLNLYGNGLGKEITKTMNSYFDQQIRIYWGLLWVSSNAQHLTSYIPW